MFDSRLSDLYSFEQLYYALLRICISNRAAGLSQYAAEAGLDTEAFEVCLNSGKYASLVNSETSTAQSLGVTGTPAFLVNGQPLVGAQPFEVFQQVIEAELGAGQ